MQNVKLAAGIVIRDLETHEERLEAVRIQHEVWGAGFSESVPAAILMVAQKTGGVAAGAFTDSGRLLGFVFGVTGVQQGRLVHWSDLLAVRDEARGHHLGETLKWYQRDRCRAIGVGVMFWTFDPFVARNAWLNLGRLGASIHEFVPDMYGSGTGSRVHALGTDRFVAEWAVGQDVVPLHPLAGAADRVVVVASGGRDCPLASDPLPEAADIAVDVPRDHTVAIAVDFAATQVWYLAVRRAFTHYLARGYRVSGFERRENGDGRYLLSHQP